MKGYFTTKDAKTRRRDFLGWTEIAWMGTRERINDEVKDAPLPFFQKLRVFASFVVKIQPFKV